MHEIIDFNDPGQCRMLFAHLRSLKGPQRVEIKKYRPRRSDRQNRMYWSAIVWPFAQWLGENYGEPFTEDEAHYVLKKTFLTRRVPHPKTGKVVEVVGSSAALDTEGFAEYVERCIHLLAEHCGIVVQDPETRTAAAATA